MGTTSLHAPVTLTRDDAWHRQPAARLQELAREVHGLQTATQRANAALASGQARNARIARAALIRLEASLLERRRYVVTFRRHHRI